jgi:hypothetical protein
VTGGDVGGDSATRATEEVVAGRAVVVGSTVLTGVRAGDDVLVVAAATVVVAPVVIEGTAVWVDDAHAARSATATSATADAETVLVGCVM